MCTGMFACVRVFIYVCQIVYDNFYLISSTVFMDL